MLGTENVSSTSNSVGKPRKKILHINLCAVESVNIVAIDYFIVSADY